ncbi:GGDEF domain-containing protein [Niallia taxi]|uniref:GGDEF domain-containing protein n=1 Tax=Niallia taxi TaxID=2499688 RepID=UPI0015F3916D|nr:GGDEF domain-containing protein [Niallia taxi]
MKHDNILYYFLILITATLPIAVHPYFSDETQLFSWSLFLIPTILIVNRFPKWWTVFLSGCFFTGVKFTLETQYYHPDIELFSLIASSVTNWSILLAFATLLMKLKKANKTIEDLAMTDSLTGLYNRRFFDSYLAQVIADSKNTKTPLCLIILDIDHFKCFNDKHGHAYGDQALKHVVEIVQPFVLPTGVFTRIGGEEFAIILPRTPLLKAEIIANNIVEAVAGANFSLGDNELHLTVSLGLAEYHKETVDDFFHLADNALYQAKHNGRNQLSVCS